MYLSYVIVVTGVFLLSERLQEVSSRLYRIQLLFHDFKVFAARYKVEHFVKH